MKTTISTIAMLVAMTAAAAAADLPSRRAPAVFVPPPPAFSWTGFYIGAQAGYAFGRDTTTYSLVGFPFLTTGSSPNGVIGGGHVGYNFEVPGTLGFGGLVAGIEGSIDGSDYKKTLVGTGLFTGASASVRSDLQASVRGRIGIAFDRVLFYATGGAAFADFRNVTDAQGILGPGAIDAADHTRVGYTVGGGIEYAFTPNWSVGAEYRYSDFGRFSESLNNISLGLVTASHRETIQQAQARISYRFDTPVAPVVAKY